MKIATWKINLLATFLFETATALQSQNLKTPGYYILYNITEYREDKLNVSYMLITCENEMKYNKIIISF